MSKSQQPEPQIAYSLERNNLGWQTVEYHILNGKVVKEKRSEPEIRGIALETFRRMIAHFWNQ